MSETIPLLLDIETTGLSREKNQLISIGIAPHGGIPIFLFSDDLAGEKKILSDFLVCCTSYDTLYTYGGKHFDYPFLLERLKYHELDPTPFLKLKLIDLKKALSPIGANRKELEALLHITRESSSTGRDIVKLYKTYLNCHQSLYKELILTHQKDELSSLNALAELYTLLIVAFKSTSEATVTQTASELILYLKTELMTAYDLTCNLEAFHLELSTKLPGQLKITLPVYHGTLRRPLRPLKDYCYIPSQQKLMHKSLATFLPKELKRSATKAECALFEEDDYLRLFSTYKVNETLWYNDEDHAFISLKDFTLSLYTTQLYYFFFETYIKNKEPIH